MSRAILKARNPIFLIPLALFAVLWLHGALLGPTDDEAYYWVLGQHPQMGYAYHPPAIGWTIALFQGLFSGFLGTASTAMLRLPAAAISAVIVALALRWLRRCGATEVTTGAWVLLSLAGVFAASWMMVPDLPLMLGYALVFTSAWELCYGARRILPAAFWLAVGVCLALLSKYSAVLIAGSAGLSVLFIARESRRRWAGVAAILIGVGCALVPIVAFNMRTGWGSVLYQLSERHGGAISWMRYLRFWGVELLIAGPTLVWYALVTLPRRAFGRPSPSDARFFLFFIAPAAFVFCVQPLFSDFKVHWALVVWFPAALALARESALHGLSRLARIQRAYGLGLAAVFLVVCQVPLLIGLVKDPKLDVTNDMRGWDKLRPYLQNVAPIEDQGLPIVGSRYQTASQAALAIGDWERVALVPRDLKQLTEWRDLDAVDAPGPGWPRLLKPVLFVTDNRYTAGPEFGGAKCVKRTRLETFRVGKLARWIEVYRCDPASSR